MQTGGEARTGQNASFLLAISPPIGQMDSPCLLPENEATASPGSSHLSKFQALPCLNTLHEQLWGDPVPICRYSTCNFFSEPYDNKLPHCCRFTFKHFRVCFLQNRTFSHIPIVHTSQSQDTPTDALTSSSPETEYGSGVEYLKLCVSHMPYQTLIYSLAYIRMDSCLLCSPHGF